MGMTEPSRIYQISYPAQWPDGRPFDPIGDHDARLQLDKVIKRWRQAAPGERADYVLDSIDATAHTVALKRPRSISSIEQIDPNRKRIRLQESLCKPNKWREATAIWENQMPGWRMIRFDPWKGEALMGKLDDEQIAARAILSQALRITPLQLTVEHAKDGGWHVELENGVVYSTTQDAALQTAVNTKGVGRPGWWFKADPSTGVIDIHPGQLPTFDKAYPYPFDMLGGPEWKTRASFGVQLPDHGGEKASPLILNWKESSFLLVGGEGGTGKSVAINDLLAGEIAQRVNLAIVDMPNKASDYYWARPWVTPGYWGCESTVQGMGVLNRLVHEIEHGERADVWKQYGWQSWYDIPDWAKRKYPLFDIVIDEYSTLVDGAMTIKSLPNPDKTLPAVYEQYFNGHVAAKIKSNVIRLLRTARAQGYRMILISQTINDKSGLGPTTRDLFGHRMVMGPNPSEALVRGTFHDPTAVPDVPKNILDEGVSKGVGRSELGGDLARIFKTYWAGEHGLTDTQVFGRRLAEAIGLPDDVDRDRYLDTLREHKGDDPIDVKYMRHLTDRVSMPYGEAMATDAILTAIRDNWDESKMNFGVNDSAPGDGTGDDGDAPAAPVKPKDRPDGNPAPGGSQLMDAADLARLMEGRN